MGREGGQQLIETTQTRITFHEKQKPEGGSGGDSDETFCPLLASVLLGFSLQ